MKNHSSKIPDTSLEWWDSHYREFSTRIALVGGGTWGHVMPIVALTRYIREQKTDAAFLWIGESGSMEERFAQENKLDFRTIPSYRISSMRSWRMIPAMFRMMRGFFQARSILKKFKPQTLFSKWWPGAISVVLAAKTLHIPVYIHDSDTIPGLSNRTSARLATRIFLGFEEAKSYFPGLPTEVIGQILPASLLRENLESDAVHFPENKRTRVLVICGSQGSRAIYRGLIDQMSNLQDFEFIISLGTQNAEFDFSEFNNVRTFPWLSESLGDLYREADIVISRGGATNLAEAVAFGAKVVSIPLPIAAFDHQRANVRVYEKKGLAILLEEDNLSQLTEILENNKGRRNYVWPRYDILAGVERISHILIWNNP